MNDKLKNIAPYLLYVTIIICLTVCILLNNNHVAELNELELSKDATISGLMEEVQQLNSEVVDYKYAVDHLDKECTDLVWKLYLKDRMLIESGIQPYELLPCYSCGSEVVIGVDYDEDVFYVGCTECYTYTQSFRESEDAAIYWNNIAK